MSVKDELLFDFAVNLPRILVSGDITVIDHVKRIVLFSELEIVVHNGSKYTVISGRKLEISRLREERMLVTGEVENVRFVESLSEIEN